MTRTDVMRPILIWGSHVRTNLEVVSTCCGRLSKVLHPQVTCAGGCSRGTCIVPIVCHHFRLWLSELTKTRLFAFDALSLSAAARLGTFD